MSDPGEVLFRVEFGVSRYHQMDVLWMQTVPVPFSGTVSYDEKRRRRGGTAEGSLDLSPVVLTPDPRFGLYEATLSCGLFPVPAASHFLLKMPIGKTDPFLSSPWDKKVLMQVRA